MKIKLNKLMLALLCAAPLVLAGCMGHNEHPGDSATDSGTAAEHSGESGATDSGAGSSEHPGE